MHKRKKALIVTGVITVNNKSSALEVIASQIDKETTGNSKQIYNTQDNKNNKRSNQ